MKLLSANMGSTYKNKKILFILMIVLLTALLLSTFVSVGFAEDAATRYDSLLCEDETKTKAQQQQETYKKRKAVLEETENAGALLATAWEMDCIVSGTHPEMSFSNAAYSVTNIRKFNFSYGPKGHEVTVNIPSLVGAAYTTLIPVGMALMVLYFLIELLNDVQLDSFTTEKFVRRLLVLAIAIVILLNGVNIFTTIIDFSDTLSADVKDAITFNDDPTGDASRATWITLYNAGREGGIFSALAAVCAAIGVMLKNLITWLLMWVAIVFIYFIAYSRLIEVAARFILAPIGCASLVSSGQQGAAHSPGMRYIRKFASVCLQGAVIIAGVGGASILSSVTKGMNNGDSIIGVILIPIALIGFCTKTQHIADEVVGV